MPYIKSNEVSAVGKSGEWETLSIAEPGDK